MSKKRIFAEEHPEYLKYWDFDKNTLDPYKIGPMCNEKAYWKCEHGHSFIRTVDGFVRRTQKCPVCQDRKANVISKPEIMKFWDFEKNTLDPETTRANSEEYAWFKCPKCGYSWQAQIRARQRKDKCPVCETNMVVHKGVNDFRTVYPQLALDTSDEMNPDIDLNSLGAGAHVRIHWKCHVCGFEWDAPVYGRIRRYKGNYKIASCPACSKNQRKDGYDIDYPELVPLYSPNNPIPFQDVRGYNTKLLWICPKHGEFEQELRNMMRAVKNGNTGCPYCHGSQVHPDESFGVLHPEFVKEWDESNEKTPYDYTEHSSYIATWRCPDCGTKWEAALDTRAAGYGKCPKCYGSQTFKERYPELEKFYSKDNDFPFEDGVVSDHTYRLWTCEHGHEFEDSFNNIYKRGFRCPYCESVKVLQGFNDFATLEPEYAKDYDETLNGNTASDVLINNRPAYFKCKNGHSFKRPVIQHIKSNGVCPICNRTFLQKGTNDLATVYPEVIPLWDHEKNEKEPDEVMATLQNYYYFVCDEGHEFKCSLNYLVSHNFECPVCKGERVDPNRTALTVANPELAKEVSSNYFLSADKISVLSDKKILWNCPECGDDYWYPVNLREVHDDSCPYCNHTQLKTGNNDLTITNPQLAAEWSPNNTKPANEVGEWQAYVAYWICPECGSEYRCEVRNRSVGDDSCPVCTNKRVEKGINDLATTDPDIAALLSSNNERKADTLIRNFSMGAEWICPTCGGEYPRRICDKTPDDSDCPYCHGTKVLTGYNDLATTNPELVPQYSSLNERPATMVRKDLNSYVYWECPECHYVYARRLNEKAPDNSDCPACNHAKTVQGVNTLQAEFPEIAEYLSPNNDFTADEILSTSFRNVKWICPTCGGEYFAPVKDMVKGLAECPYCNNQRPLAGFNTLKALYPEVAEHLSPNNDFTADEILPTSTRNAKWVCSTCGGEYFGTVKDMVEGIVECPYCNNQRPLAGFNTLKALYPEIAEHLSPNNDFTADEILPTRVRSTKWICPTCGGEYTASVKDMVNGLAKCPYCDNKRHLVGFNTLKALYPEIAEEMSPDNEKGPDDVLPTSSYIVEWICPTCGGEYSASVKDMVSGNVECPYCSNEKPLAGFNTLKALYPDIAKQMTPNNEKGPDDVLPTSSYIAEWTCSKCGYTYKASVKDRVKLGNLCPACAGKKAQAGLNSLLDVYPEIQDEWAENENTLLGIFPDEILPTSTFRVWWECKDCGRKYLLSVNMWVEKHIRGMTSCTYCSGLRMRETHILL